MLEGVSRVRRVLWENLSPSFAQGKNLSCDLLEQNFFFVLGLETPWVGHHLPALICGFSGEKKTTSFIFGRNIAHVKIVP
jgi:hypothetical protein